MVFNPHAGFSSSSSTTTKKPTRPTRERDYFGSMYTTSGGSGSTTSSSSNTGQVNPNDPVIAQSIQDRKSAYESMRDAGMLTPSLSGISLYDKSPVIYEPGTTSEDILGADNPADIGGQQVDLTGTKVDGLTPFYTTYAEDAVNTGNITEDVYRYAISQGKTNEEAQALVSQANAELNKLVSQYRAGDKVGLDDFLAGYNPFFKSILPQTMYGEGIGVGGFTGSDTGYVGLEDETGRFFKIQDPTPNILANRSGFGGGGGGMSFGGGSSYAAGIGSGLLGRPKQLGDAEKIPGQLRLLQYMVNVHRGNPYTKMAMRKKDGGLASIVGD
jgi:hypothetical protein|tara:strand:- start:215 stop:1198 length:984 start_codon:yes stop_codon:yes gene_type:complete